MNHRKIVGMGLLLLIAACVSVAWATEAPRQPTPEPVAVSFGVSFDVVLDGIVAATRTGGSYGCAAPFSCNEPCGPQLQNCRNNCNGNIDCVFDCFYCNRVCEFTC